MPEKQSRLVLSARGVSLSANRSPSSIQSVPISPSSVSAGGSDVGVEKLIADSNDARAPKVARVCIAALGAPFRQLKTQILELQRWERQACRRPHRKRHTLKKVVHPGSLFGDPAAGG